MVSRCGTGGRLALAVGLACSSGCVPGSAPGHRLRQVIGDAPDLGQDISRDAAGPAGAAAEDPSAGVQGDQSQDAASLPPPAPTPALDAQLTADAEGLSDSGTSLDSGLALDTGVPVDPGGAGDPILVGAGDIASCSNSTTRERGTALLLDGIPGTVFTAGDNAYPDGTATDYSNCYDPTWGRHKARTMPSPGNHEYHTAGASGYYSYFGATARDPTTGYYSYDLGSWHIVVINSNCAEVGGCAAGSTQEQWLRADLAANPTRCTLAYWHHPRFSSGSVHGNSTEMQPIWQALYDAGADLVISGHEHTYERFAPQTPSGQLDQARGIREFVVGTGGQTFYSFNAPEPNSEVRNNVAHGVLKLTLHPQSYDWQFVHVAGEVFDDVGTGTCH